MPDDAASRSQAPIRSSVVSICIPTYAAEGFIERTLACALGQTYPSIQLLISVDLCEDRTLELCQSAARRDPRIRVVGQTKRLGWSQNVNATLDRVDSEFAFVYFHDDLIEPTYVERLVEALVREPGAASAHCDLAEFGLMEQVRTAHDYRGSSLERLADFMMTHRGTTLRSMLRMRAMLPSVRHPEIVGDNRWTAYAFHIALLASGPAVAVRETLYRRWQRPGSLTRSAGWLATTLDATLAAVTAAARCYIEVMESAIQSPDERRVALYCLRLFLTGHLLDEQLRLKDGTRHDIGRLVPALGDHRAAFLPNVLGPAFEDLLRHREDQIDRLAAEVATIGTSEPAAQR